MKNITDEFNLLKNTLSDTMTGKINQRTMVKEFLIQKP